MGVCNSFVIIRFQSKKYALTLYQTNLYFSLYGDGIMPLKYENS